MVAKFNRDSEYLKPFWNEWKPYFSNKHTNSKIILIEKEKITSNSIEVIKKEKVLVNNDEITRVFNKHFAETVETLIAFECSSNNPDLLNDQHTAISIKLQINQVS